MTAPEKDTATAYDTLEAINSNCMLSIRLDALLLNLQEANKLSCDRASQARYELSQESAQKSEAKASDPEPSEH
jgi:hypothetical protein